MHPRVITIPSSDRAFREHVAQLQGDSRHPADLERRLRRVFPRVVVRERSLSAEAPAWYVYRDGGWRPPSDEQWWKDTTLPRVVFSADGWLKDANQTACAVLGIDRAEVTDHHFTDFAVPGTLDDYLALFRVVEGGKKLTATILLRPVSGAVIGIDLHAVRHGTDVVGVFRLASDLEALAEAPPWPGPVSLRTVPATDVAFRGYVLRALGRMPEPTPQGLALRLRRLYPHASTRTEGGGWIAQRDPDATDGAASGWWQDERLPRIRYDAQALILDANPAAEAFLGRELVGHYWQEFVTPGSTEEVTVMLDILAEVGAAESRFRIPRADGSLVEFHSYTIVHGEEFMTVMRPADPVSDPSAALGSPPPASD